MPPIPKSVLKAYFEKGDKPTQSQFSSLIDSSLNLVDDMKYLGLKIYSTTLPYQAGDITVHDGIFYEAIATTSGVFDPSKWAELSTSGSAIISVTYSALSALKTSGNLSPGQIYYISDKGIWVDAITTGEFNLSGSYLAVNADYQNLSGNSLGIWNAALTGIIPGVSFVIWNNLHWQSVTGDAGANPDIDPTNWSLIPPPSSTYAIEIDEIKYDFDLDFIFERSDKRGNFVSSMTDPEGLLGLIPIERFQWGRDGVNGNFVKNSVLDILNCNAKNYGMQVTNFSSVYLSENADCSKAIISMSWLVFNGTTNLKETIMRNSSIRVLGDFNNPGKRIEPGFSNFEATIDITGVTMLTLFTAPYAGIIHLTSTNATETLTNFDGSPQYPVELRPATGLEVEIQTGTMHASQFVMPVVSLLLKGDFGDYAKFRSGPGLTLRYMESVNYAF